MFGFLTEHQTDLGMMPHGQCYLWDQNLVLLHAISDLAIFFAYISIPIALMYFLYQRRDFPFPLLFTMFCLFIFACGATHLVSFWNIWHADYWLAGILKLITAIVSIVTGVILIPFIPEALNLPSPKVLAMLNAKLRHHALNLESANKELKDFAYIVSHDLKAPLRGINKLSHWLVSDYADKLQDEGKEMLDLLSSRVKRMDSLIEGILQYSRVGRASNIAQKVDLNQLVANVIDLISPAKNITIKITSPLPSLELNETLVSQLFQNLLSNACKFIDKPQGEISVSCIENADMWEFHVADNGMGIEAQYFDKVFQIFQTLTARDEQENTGIGLSIVKKVVGLLQGRVWVKSTLGVGSTFIFTIPKQ